MKIEKWMVCAAALACFLVIGCKEKNKSAVVVGQPVKASSGAASAEQVAMEMRGNVQCPAKPTSQRPAGAPIDDVVGVRPGMPLDEAAHVVLCDNPLLVVTENTSRGYDIPTFGQHIRQGFDAKFAEPRTEKTSRDILREMQEDAMRRGSNTYVAPLKSGQVRYFVSSMGLPSQEQVLSVAREEYFQDGKSPSVESVKQALISKYGQPSQIESSGAHTYLWWEYETNGNKIVEGSPNYAACRINVSPDSGTSLSTACGVSVGALIQGEKDNSALAHSLAVTSQNGAMGYAVLKTTQEALQRNDEVRRAREVTAAGKNANQPKL
ncbi:MAG: hypothetical protein JSS87_00220 [Acidobacteria bacterium]|nr:hypothetical protein [Acidobacteriota bacterium]